MEQDSIRLINKLNKEIIKLRGTYSLWSGLHHISYNEMLVLYTIREYGFCTQKRYAIIIYCRARQLIM